VSYSLPRQSLPREATQQFLLFLAVGFVFFVAIGISLSPSARVQSWFVEYRWQHWLGFMGWAAGFGLIHRLSRRFMSEADPYLIPILALLSGWGLMIVWRLNPALGMRQTLWLIVGIGVISYGIRQRNILDMLRRYKYLWLISGMLVTALTYFFGSYPGGTGPKLWLGCCGFYFQPSEPLKLLLVVYLAAYLSDRLPTTQNLLHLLAPTLVMIGVTLLLVIGQQDLGTASLLVVIYTLTVFLSSGRLSLLLIIIPLLAAAGYLGYQQFPVVQLRINSWLNPWLDPSGSSYQIIQSLMAVAAGGLLGQGAGLGSPGVVPIAHSDFIFSAIAEEFGLIGVLGFIGLYGLLVHRGFLIAIKASDSFRRILAAGLTLALVIQVILIAGGNIRLLPLTGVTLPFISYGGSSLVTGMISILLILLVSNETEVESAPISSPMPYLYTSAVLLSGLFILSLAAGYWSIIRSDQLLSRTDNPRRSIADRYSRRGAFLDHNNQIISYTSGNPGDFTRNHLYPPLSTTIGYSSPIYGQFGLEGTMDSYLRGVEGNNLFVLWWNRLLNGYPPPGLNVRVSIDLDLQQITDQLMEGHKGAAVLLNARTGEILVLSSHPYFDPNTLEQDWKNIIVNPNAPLINRATQSRYSPGASLGPFLLMLYQFQSQLPDLPEKLNYYHAGKELRCAIQPGSRQPLQWQEAIASGCPSASMQLGSHVQPLQLQNLFQKLGFYTAPSIPIPVSKPDPALPIRQGDLAAIGEENLLVTPLQMALAASAITTNGFIPEPFLTTALQTPDGKWTVLENQPGRQAISPIQSIFAREMLTLPDTNYWQTIGLAQSSFTTLTWFLGGTITTTSEVPLAIAVVLEEDNPSLAQQVGQKLLSYPLFGQR